MTESNIRNVLLVGVGGQGILLASEIVAQAALNAGHRVKTNETHGMAQRGGSVMANVRYGPEVHGPLVAEGEADVLGALEQIEALRFAHYLAPGKLAVVSSQTIVPVTVSSGKATYPQDVPERLKAVFPRLVYLKAADQAAALGNARMANVVLLGAMSRELDLPVESWREAVAATVPEKHRDANVQAFDAGRG